MDSFSNYLLSRRTGRNGIFLLCLWSAALMGPAGTQAQDSSAAPYYPESKPIQFGASALKVATYAAPDGMTIHLRFENPERENLIVQLIYEGNHMVYSHRTNVAVHHFKFRMADGYKGLYEIRVIGKTHRFSRQVAIVFPRQGPYLDLLPPSWIAIR